MKKTLAGIALCTLLTALPLTAAPSFSVTPAIGTLGYGGSFGIRGDRAGVRLAVHKGSHSQDLTKNDIDYNGTLKMDNAGAVFDFYPGGGSFHLSAGAYSNKNRIDLVSSPTNTITVNGVAYPASVVGNVTGDVKFKTTAPYAGIGWSSRPHRGIGFAFDLGALFQGSPRLAVQPHPSNPALVPASFYTNLEAERAKTEKDISNYQYWPVVSFGITFGF